MADQIYLGLSTDMFRGKLDKTDDYISSVINYVGLLKW